MPKVLNKRTDIIPEGAVYVGRPTKWGNPYRIGSNASRAARLVAVEGYREWVTSAYPKSDIRAELGGKDLVCWCSPEPCHADVLLEIANDPV